MAMSFSGAKNYKKHNGFSKNMKIKKPLPSAVCVYPLRQSTDILLVPIVNEGDYVLAGQKIAELDTFGALPLFSGVSGTVISVNEMRIVVENDLLQNYIPSFTSKKSFSELTQRERLWILREKGVIEPRTSLPLHVMLSPEKKPDCVILCCFDSDPYVSSPQAAAEGNVKKLMHGLRIVLDILYIKKAVIGVESCMKRTYCDFKIELRYNENILLYALKERFPQSRDDILTKTLTGRADTNALILSPETLLAAVGAFETGEVRTNKIVTVSGDDILNPENFLVPVGSTIASVLESAGYTNPRTVIDGGITDGRRVFDLDAPIKRDTKAILAFNNTQNIPHYAASALRHSVS